MCKNVPELFLSALLVPHFYHYLPKFLADIEEASIYDAGYKVGHKRKYFSRKKKTKELDRDFSTRPSGAKRGPKKKKFDKDGNEIKVKKHRYNVDKTITELTGGLYAPCSSKDKKVCGPIVAPLDLLKNNDEGSRSSTNTDELVQTLLEQETDKLGIKKRKHKEHKHKENCKKYRKKSEYRKFVF